jgi:hypothetical protein
LPALTSTKETAIPTKAQDKSRTPEDESSGAATLVRRHVLNALGRPDGLLRVVVCPLWDDHYRVNVLVGGDAATASVSDSFFVVADDAGAVVRSIPAIKRRYGTP